MKSNKIRNILLVVLILVILGLAVAYASLAQTLTINGTAKAVMNWDVEITNIRAQASNSANGATLVSGTTPSYDATSATFSVNLARPGATGTFTITVANKGNINAVLSSISGIDAANASAPVGITYSINAVPNAKLNAGETTTYDVTVKWDTDAPFSTDIDHDGALSETYTKTATITLNYVQANS